MTQRLQRCAVAHLKLPVRCLCLVVSLISVCVLMESATPASETPYMPLEPPAAEPREPIVPIPLSLALDPQRVALGERLFSDVRLSHNNTYSCTTCHPLERGGMDGQSRATTTNETIPLRNTPTIFNVGLNATLNWDGITNTLEPMPNSSC